MRRDIKFQQNHYWNCKKGMREKKVEWCDWKGEKNEIG